MRHIKAGLIILTLIGIAAGCVVIERISSIKADKNPIPDQDCTLFQASEGASSEFSGSGNYPQSSSQSATAVTSLYLPAITSGNYNLLQKSPEDVIRTMLNEVDPERATDDIKRLSGEELICTVSGCNLILNRSTCSEGLKWAKEYVFAEFSELGYQVEYQNWSRSGYADQNIIARKPGVQLPGEEIYLVAHLDGVDKSDSDRYPAADDNASGVVSILELARVFSQYQFSRTLIMLISTGEENGTLGVLEFLEDLSPNEFVAISKVINIDMIGYDANQDHVMQLWHGNHPPSKEFAKTIEKTILQYQLSLKPDLATGCG